MSQRAHGNCTYCQSRIEQCIYRYFGPCRFDPAEAVSNGVDGTEATSSDQMPAPDVLKTGESTAPEPESAYQEILKLL